MSHDNAVIATYPTHLAAEAAIRELERSGFEMKQLSIVGHDIQTDEQVVGYYNVQDRMKVWGRNGAFWGGLWGFLFAPALFVIPGLGPTLVAGQLVGMIAGALEGAVAVGGLSIVGAALYNLGIPKDSIVRYETAIRTGRYVLIAHGTHFDATLAREILHRTAPELLDHHERPCCELRTGAGC
jgi:hypothetical protein